MRETGKEERKKKRKRKKKKDKERQRDVQPHMEKATDGNGD